MAEQRDPVVFQRKGSGRRWDFYFLDENNRRIYRRCPKSIAKKDDARKYARDKQAEYHKPKFPEPEPQAPTLSEFCEGFFDWNGPWVRTQQTMDRAFSRSTARMRAGHLANWILKDFGSRRLEPGFVTAAEIQQWLVGLKLANQTRNHVLFTWRIVLHQAQMGDRLLSNPAELVPMFGRNPDSPDPFTLPDFALMFPPSMSKCLRIWGDLKHLAAFMTLASTGIRSGELRALQWLHLVEDPPAMVIARGVKNDGSIGTTKTNQTRVVVLPKRTLAILRQWRAATPARAPGHLIFCGEGPDHPWHREALSGALPSALARAKVETEGRRLVVHSFRHAYVSTFRRRLPEELLRMLSGHRSKALEEYDQPSLQELLKHNLDRCVFR